MLCFYVSFRGLIMEEDSWFVEKGKQRWKKDGLFSLDEWIKSRILEEKGRGVIVALSVLLPAFRWGRGMPQSRFFGVCTGTCWSGILFPARAIACSCRPCVISLAVRFLQRNRECFFFFLFLFHSSNGKCAANGIGSRIVVLPLEREYSFVLSNCTS